MQASPIIQLISRYSLMLRRRLDWGATSIRHTFANTLSTLAPALSKDSSHGVNCQHFLAFAENGLTLCLGHASHMPMACMQSDACARMLAGAPQLLPAGCAAPAATAEVFGTEYVSSNQGVQPSGSCKLNISRLWYTAALIGLLQSLPPLTASPAASCKIRRKDIGSSTSKPSSGKRRWDAVLWALLGRRTGAGTEQTQDRVTPSATD